MSLEVLQFCQHIKKLSEVWSRYYPTVSGSFWLRPRFTPLLIPSTWQQQAARKTPYRPMKVASFAHVENHLQSHHIHLPIFVYDVLEDGGDTPASMIVLSTIVSRDTF